MTNKCVIGQLRHISSVTDKYITKLAKEMNIPVLKNHIPMFYILPEDGSMMAFNELAKRWDISKSSLSDIVSKYTEMGIVEKHECNEDKRVIYLRLTSKGVKIKKQMEDIENKIKIHLYGEISDEKQEQFEMLLEEIINNINV